MFRTVGNLLRGRKKGEDRFINRGVVIGILRDLVGDSEVNVEYLLDDRFYAEQMSSDKAIDFVKGNFGHPDHDFWFHFIGNYQVYSGRNDVGHYIDIRKKFKKGWFPKAKRGREYESTVKQASLNFDVPIRTKTAKRDAA